MIYIYIMRVAVQHPTVVLPFQYTICYHPEKQLPNSLESTPTLLPTSGVRQKIRQKMREESEGQTATLQS